MSSPLSEKAEQISTSPLSELTTSGTPPDEEKRGISGDEEAGDETSVLDDSDQLTPVGSQNRPNLTITESTRSNNGYGVSDDLESPPQPGEKDPFEVSWDGGDDDPLSPRSMNLVRKWVLVLLISACCLNLTAASSIYTSTYEQIEAEFHNSRELSTLGLSLLVLGLSLGPMFFGPMSEFYGRRPIYLVSWTVYLIWLIPTAVAHNIETILISRFFAGFAGSAFLAVAGGTVGDLFSKENLQAPMAIFTISPFIGPSIGPLIGGFINYNVNWRWTWYTWIIFTGALWICLVFALPETYHPIVLVSKARKIRKETGDDRYFAPTEKVEKSVLKALSRSLFRPFQLLIFEIMVLNLCILSAILLGIIYLFFGAFPIVFGEVYGFNLWQIGLTFVGMLVGNILATMIDPLWHHIRTRLMQKLEAESGVKGASEPEFRLPSALVGAILCPVGLFVFGWTAYPSVHWIVPIIGSAIFGAGVIMVFVSIWTFLVDAYPLYAASALAANSFVRCMFATAFPLFGDQMYRKLGIHWATSLLAFLALMMLPFPYLFFKYGKQLRAKSRFAKA